jgi:hypothetical protein
MKKFMPRKISKLVPKNMKKMTPKRMDVLTKINIVDDVESQFGKLGNAIKKTSKMR